MLVSHRRTFAKASACRLYGKLKLVTCRASRSICFSVPSAWIVNQQSSRRVQKLLDPGTAVRRQCTVAPVIANVITRTAHNVCKVYYFVLLRFGWASLTLSTSKRSPTANAGCMELDTIWRREGLTKGMLTVRHSGSEILIINTTPRW